MARAQSFFILGLDFVLFTQLRAGLSQIRSIYDTQQPTNLGTELDDFGSAFVVFLLHDSII
jgi:hypothetical protein